MAAVIAERSEAQQQLAEETSKVEVLAMKNESIEELNTSIASEMEQEREQAMADMQVGIWVEVQYYFPWQEGIRGFSEEYLISSFEGK